MLGVGAPNKRKRSISRFHLGPSEPSTATTAISELKPVKKFTNRKAAVARIWAAVQRLSADTAEPAADVAATKGKAKNEALVKNHARRQIREDPIRAP